MIIHVPAGYITNSMVRHSYEHPSDPERKMEGFTEVHKARPGCESKFGTTTGNYI